jgi:hypothetical protein
MLGPFCAKARPVDTIDQLIAITPPATLKGAAVKLRHAETHIQGRA